MVNALVVGASGGIGREVTAQLRAHDSLIMRTADCVGDVDDVINLADLGGEGVFLRWLTASWEADKAPSLIAWCPGVYDREDCADYTIERMHAVVNINLMSFLVFARALSRQQRRDGHPRRLAVVGSQAWATGGKDAVYAASKAGLVAAVKSLAREYADRGLLANVVSPGPTDTPMADKMGERRQYYERVIPVGRFNQAAEVASVVTWLLADAPETITGTVIDIDGGLVRR
jgi:NAD(P)-dependent dehydrogenase (short-subunit alcohol dehydrogenase family)